MPAEVVLRVTPVVVGSGIARLQADCLVVVRDGFLMPAEVVLRVTPVVVGSGQFWIQVDCLVIGTYNFFRGSFLMFLVEITYGKPSPSSEFFIGNF